MQMCRLALKCEMLVRCFPINATNVRTPHLDRVLSTAAVSCHQRQLCKEHMAVRVVHTFRHSSSSVSGVVDLWIQILTSAAVPDPRESVHLIVAHALGKQMLHEVDVSKTISSDVSEKINKMCQKRLNRCPVQYIIGEWDFHDMTLKMEPPVLIPRPETEELAAFIIEEYQKIHKQKTTDMHTQADTDIQTRGDVGVHTRGDADIHMQGDGWTPRFLDIGCGCGALSLYFLKSIPEAWCVSVDQNETACSLTRHNAVIHGLNGRLQIVHGDIFHDDTIREIMKAGPYDIIVSNPPYIPSVDMEHLQAEVHRFEDHKALEGGTDGLDIVRQILNISSSLLTSDGQLWLEVDLSHPATIQHLVHQNPGYQLQYTQTLQDFTHRDRFCKLKIKS